MPAIIPEGLRAAANRAGKISTPTQRPADCIELVRAFKLARKDPALHPG